MKFLFIVQGEGRGHLTQALTLQEILRKNGHEVTRILVGKSRTKELPAFFLNKVGPLTACFESPHFTPKLWRKRINLFQSVFYSIRRIPAYIRSIRFLKKEIEESQADRVINFYEMLTGLTYLFRSPSVPQICIGHQYLFLHSGYDFPTSHKSSKFFLKWITHITCLESSGCLALSFRPLDEDSVHGIRVVPPLLRREVLRTEPTKEGYIHGYMVNAGFAENICNWHAKNPEVPLHFFWESPDKETVKEIDKNLCFHGLDDCSFLESLKGCMGYATTAGFESVCEAMYLKKPVLMVPAHIEQDCNAFEAGNIGAGIVSRDFNLDVLIEFAKTYVPVAGFASWVEQAEYSFLRELEKEINWYDPDFSEMPVPDYFPA